jgi:uncharacterized protein YkwD
MKHLSKYVASILFCFAMAACSSSKEAVVDDRSEAKIVKEVLRLVNDYRESKNLQPLKLVDAISTEARKHSQNMASRRVAVGHDGFDGRYKNIQKNVARVGGGAENVAYGNVSAKEIVKGWIKSPHHRENMEGYFNITGIGVVRDSKGTRFYTQIFINQTKK